MPDTNGVATNRNVDTTSPLYAGSAPIPSTSPEAPRD
jgi:hypothetical protein